MSWLDRVFLLLTGLSALFTIFKLIHRQKVHRPYNTANYFHIIALSVLLFSGLLLIVFGWSILGLMGESIGNRLVAIVASLIPFTWATGVVARIYSKAWKWYGGVMILGILLIILSRFSNRPDFARVVYPIFHGIAGLTVIVVPLISIRRQDLKPSYALISLGGLYISTGGISLAFLMAGRQLAFFSSEVVLTILAPLLFLTTVNYGIGLLTGDR